MAKKAEVKSEEQIFQEKYLEYNQYKAQMQGLSEEFSTLAITNQALSTARGAVENFEKLKDGAEILVPLGAQVFAKANLSNVNEVLVNIGAGAVVKKDIPKALKSLESQQKEVEALSNHIASQLKELGERVEALEPELDAYAEKLRAKKEKQK